MNIFDKSNVVKNEKKVDNEGFTRVTHQRKRNFVTNFQQRNHSKSFYVFNGYCFNCNNYGHKISNCQFLKAPTTFVGRNRFFPLRNYDIECFNCHNFGHIATHCRNISQQQHRRTLEPISSKVWKKKQPKSLIVQTAFKAHNKPTPWILDSGCSSHMTGDKQKFEILKSFEGGSVKFGNNNGAKIMGKGTIQINQGKIKSEEVLFVDGLKHNLLSISQICDKGNDVIFKRKGCEIRKENNGKLVAMGTRTLGNLYTLIENVEGSCLLGQEDESWLWHKRLGHICFENLTKIASTKAVRDIPHITKPSNSICDSCQKGKQTRTSFKTKEHHTRKPLELVHTDLCGPVRTQSMYGERYFMLCIDDYSRMTWVSFLKHKSKALEIFKAFKNQVENQIGRRIKCLRSDRGGEFTSEEFREYCENMGIRRQLSTPKTPQQNGVVERKNRTVQEMARTMLNESKVGDRFWREAIHTSVYIQNRCMLRPNEDKTPYEMWFGRKATVKYFKIFGSKCYIKRIDQNLGKFDDRADEGIFLGYSSKSKAYRCFNKRSRKMIESIDVKVDEKGNSHEIIEEENPMHEEELNKNDKQSDQEELTQVETFKNLKETTQKNK